MPNVDLANFTTIRYTYANQGLTVSGTAFFKKKYICMFVPQRERENTKISPFFGDSSAFDTAYVPQHVFEFTWDSVLFLSDTRSGVYKQYCCSVLRSTSSL